MKPSFPTTFYVAVAAAILLATPAFAARGHQQTEKQSAPVAARAASSAEQKFHRAVQAFDRRDYAAALPVLRELAARGHAQAQYRLGQMYHFGLKTEQNYRQAIHWYEKSAAQGDSYAQFNLCLMHTEGMGVAQDYRQAADWCRKSAQQGHANAQYFLGMMYDEGKGVAQDARQALDWYRKSAEQGFAPA